MRVFAISALHIDFPDNLEWVTRLSNQDYLEDIIIVAGDVCAKPDFSGDQKTNSHMPSNPCTVAKARVRKTVCLIVAAVDCLETAISIATDPAFGVVNHLSDDGVDGLENSFSSAELGTPPKRANALSSPSNRTRIVCWR